MSSHTRPPHFRPQKPLYDVIVDKWLTLTNFAWFLAAVLALVIVTLLVNGAKKLGGDEYPYKIVAMGGSQLDVALRDMDTKAAVVMLYDSACAEACERQIDTLLNLRSHEQDKEITLYFLSMDKMPENTMKYLESIHLPQSMVTYYAAPDTQSNVGVILKRRGSTGVDRTYPHTLLVGRNGKVLVEYKGYIRSQEIMRTLRMQSIINPR